MSASASKKKRKELDAQGLSQKDIHAKKESNKRKKRNRNILLIVVAVLLVAAIVVGVIALLNHRYRQTVATVGKQKISVPVYNCFYNGIASDVSQNGIRISGYTIPITITPNVPFSEQASPLGEGTLEDFMIDYANSQIQSVYILYNKAQSDSEFHLSQEAKDGIAATLESLKNTAKNYGYSNVDKFLSANYGRGVSLEDYETYLTVSFTASEYDAFMQKSFAPTDEELAAAYEEDPAAYDFVSYSYSDTTATGVVDKESEDKEITYTDEDRAKAKAEAEEKEKNFPEDAKTSTVRKASLSKEEIADWLFDAARKEGDIKTFQTDEEGNTYRTIRFDSRDTNDYNRVTAYVIAIEKDKEEQPADDSSETTDAENNDADTPETEAPETEAPETEAPETEAPETEAPETEAPETEAQKDTGEADEGNQEEEQKPTAEETLSKITDGLKPEMTDEEFEAHVKEQYKEVSSQVVDKLSYPEEVNAYLFASDRKAGDTETITTDDTYYVVRYVEASEMTYRNELIKYAKYSEMYQELMSSATINVDKKALKYAHTDLTFRSSSN